MVSSYLQATPTGMYGPEQAGPCFAVTVTTTARMKVGHCYDRNRSFALSPSLAALVRT